MDKLELPPTPVFIYTSAPETYDYDRWARTVAPDVGVDQKGQTVRLVRITDQAHADNQVARYGSGLHMAVVESEWKKLVEYNLVTAHKKYPAQIVFVEQEGGDQWIGRLMNPAQVIDTQHGDKPLEFGRRPFFNIEHQCRLEDEDGCEVWVPMSQASNLDNAKVVAKGRYERYVATQQGGAIGSRRYYVYDDLTKAQEAGIKWAARRFKVIAEV